MQRISYSIPLGERPWPHFDWYCSDEIEEPLRAFARWLDANVAGSVRSISGPFKTQDPPGHALLFASRDKLSEDLQDRDQS